MRVRVEVTLDVDAEAWCAEYGVELADVRGDVKSHAAQSLVAHFDDLGLLVDRPCERH